MPRVWPCCAAAAAIALAACVPGTAPPTPVPAPASEPRAAPPPTPAPAPPPADWQDGPLSPGDWGYGPGQRAAFGAAGPLFVVECTSSRQVTLARVGSVTGPTLAIRTSYGERSLPVSRQPSAAIAAVTAADPLLDEIAFSRGRFLVRVEGLPDLILPTWPELARVVEDCRQ